MVEPTTISDLSPGEGGHVTFTDLNVSKDGDCYLTAAAKLREKCGSSTVEVRSDGGYDVVVASNTKYMPGAIVMPREKVPVASVTVDPEEK